MPAVDVLSYYAGAPRPARLHVAGRWRLFPFPALLPYLPAPGHWLDLGCGYGLLSFYLASRFPQAHITGVDPDQEKIALACHLAQVNGLTNLQFQAGLAQDHSIPECNLVTLVDVLYLIPREQQEQILAAAAAQLEPGGHLLLKEMREGPAWKYAWNWLEEWLAVRLLGITYGRQFYFRTQAEWEGLLCDLGLQVQTVRLDHGYIHPHVLFIGEKL